MTLKNRKIYAISGNADSFVKTNFYVNFGEGRFASVTIDDFFKYVDTWKIFKGNKFVPILELGYYPSMSSFDGRAKRLLEMIIENGKYKINGKIVEFDKGNYLMEIDEFVPLKNGSIAYKPIKTYLGYEIKFQKNGVSNFAIFKNNVCLEDRFISINSCEEAIEEMEVARENKKIIEALTTFKQKFGRTWKSKLREMWFSGRYDYKVSLRDICFLQKARNKNFDLKRI